MAVNPPQKGLYMVTFKPVEKQTIGEKTTQNAEHKLETSLRISLNLTMKQSSVFTMMSFQMQTISESHLQT